MVTKCGSYYPCKQYPTLRTKILDTHSLLSLSLFSHFTIHHIYCQPFFIIFPSVRHMFANLHLQLLGIQYTDIYNVCVALPIDALANK